MLLFTFVILHYMVEKETQECIDSITLSQSEYNYKLVIIDNGSTNDSFINLKKNNKKEDIIFLENRENLGFAKANNKAFLYAKQELNTDFIIMINNDTIIIDNDFLKTVYSKYEKYNYYILGPDIITIDNYHQNPIPEPNWNSFSINSFILKRHINICLGYFGILNIDEYEGKITNDYLNKRLEEKKDLIDVPLHGACLIFSPNFLAQFNGIFPNTFLYMEEDFLRLYSKYYDFLMMFTSETNIVHKERVSSKNVSKNKKDTYIRRNKYLLKSMKTYKRVYKKIQKYDNLSINEIEKI